MRALLLVGEGPYFKNSEYLDDTLFDPVAAPALGATYKEAGLGPLLLSNLRYEDGGQSLPLIRSKRGLMPHLTSFTLDSIMRTSGVEYELFRLERVWNRDGMPELDTADVVLLSTTFICDRQTLRHAINWINERYPHTFLVLGGQYSNIKFPAILRDHPEVDVVVRGDGEDALPALLRSLEKGRDLSGVPNLVFRNETGHDLRYTPLRYIDLDQYPSPSLEGVASVIPYESMRGCPFSCKFCSFPFASPQWRYKSAAKIAADWDHYARINEAKYIRAMDSTFTVPFGRLNELLKRLEGMDLAWEAYARANNIKTERIVEALSAANCKKLSIGFESMSKNTLLYMNKRVSALENYRAFRLLKDSALGYRISFMVGYPGETPEDYEETHRFLVEEYAGHYMLSVFSFLDETMPVWQDAERFGLRIQDPVNPDYSWTHVGMDVDTARELQRRTLDETRRRSEEAIVLLWQTDYQTPLVPGLPQKANMRLEKLIERLAMAPHDYPSAVEAKPTLTSILQELADYGVKLEEASSNKHESEPSRNEEVSAV